jgi:hypothetical protein
MWTLSLRALHRLVSALVAVWFHGFLCDDPDAKEDRFSGMMS